MRRLVKEPDAFPFISNRPKIFRGVDEFLSSPNRVTGIHGNETSRIRRYENSYDQCNYKFQADIPRTTTGIVGIHRAALPVSGLSSVLVEYVSFSHTQSFFVL